MKATLFSIIIATLLIVGVFVFVSIKKGSDSSVSGNINNVSIVDGKQVIEINAKGGYSPRVTLAKAGIATVLKVATKGTFDCSAALAIPSIGYRKNLPQSAETLVDLPAQESGSVLQGLCAMGMYNFQIRFN